MDAGVAIEREALKRVLLALVAIAGIGPSAGRLGRTLPRLLHRAVLRLLRPAESAARRLVIALARGLALPAPGPCGWARSRPARGGPSMEVAAPRTLSLPLLDPPLRPFRLRRTPVPAYLAPRISVPGVSQRPRLPPPLSPDDPLDATRLCLRLEALAQALDDLPRLALRFARWRARLARARATGAPGQVRWRWPLRMGRPPGSRQKMPRHEVHDVLAHAHELAWWSLERPDTS